MADKTKNSQNKCFEKFFHCFIVILLFLPLVAVIASCGKDDKENEPTVNPAAALYGAWTANESIINDDPKTSYEKESTIIFNETGLLWTQFKSFGTTPGNGASFVGDPIEYRYKVFSNTLNLYNVDGLNSNPVTVLSYSVKGEKLNLEYITGEKPHFLYQNNMVFKRK